MDDCIYTLKVLRWAMINGCFDIEFQRSFLTTPPIFHRSRLFFLFASSFLPFAPPASFSSASSLLLLSSPPLFKCSLCPGVPTFHSRAWTVVLCVSTTYPTYPSYTLYTPFIHLQHSIYPYLCTPFIPDHLYTNIYTEYASKHPTYTLYTPLL